MTWNVTVWVCVSGQVRAEALVERFGLNTWSKVRGRCGGGEERDREGGSEAGRGE